MPEISSFLGDIKIEKIRRMSSQCLAKCLELIIARVPGRLIVMSLQDCEHMSAVTDRGGLHRFRDLLWMFTVCLDSFEFLINLTIFQLRPDCCSAVVVQEKLGDDLILTVIVPHQGIVTSSIATQNASGCRVAQQVWRIWNEAHGISLVDGLPVIEAPRRRFRDGSALCSNYARLFSMRLFAVFGHVGGLFSVHSLFFGLPVCIEVGQTFIFYQVCRRALETGEWPSITRQVYITLYTLFFLNSRDLGRF
jgi:hypothetical protein